MSSHPDLLDTRQRHPDAPTMRLYVISSTGVLHRSTFGTDRLGWTLCGAVGRSLWQAPLSMWAEPFAIPDRRTCATCDRVAREIIR